MEENKKINLEKIINAIEYMAKFFGNPYEKHLCRKTCERLRELDARRLLTETTKKRTIDLLDAIIPRKLQVWEEEMLCYILPRTTQFSLWRPHKSWIWLNLLIEEEIAKYTGICHSNSIKPSEELVLDSIIYWKHDHTNYLYDIKIDNICGFPLEVLKLPDPCEKRNLNDNKTQLERVVKRRKNK